LLYKEKWCSPAILTARFFFARADQVSVFLHSRPSRYCSPSLLASQVRHWTPFARRKLNLIFVDHIDEVFKIAIRGFEEKIKEKSKAQRS